ncbi:MAG: hypothetical protein HKN51_11135 [Saprospiraceae bacterium]|nr:hypothetical protein [Saprospiraceae bacterium]
MKKFTYVLYSALFLMSFQITAQELSEGLIKMEISEVSSDNEQVAAQLEMMKGTETVYTFSKEKSLVTANMMGGMIKIKSLVNNADEHLTFLFDAMGQKMMVESTKEERAAMEADQKELVESLDISYDEDDTKEILGYKCIKATISGDEEFPMDFSMYVSRDIKASNELIQGLQGIDLDGFPLEYIMEMEQMSMTYTATELKTEIDASVFEINTSGYQKMTFQEFQEQMGAFGGGMGF